MVQKPKNRFRKKTVFAMSGLSKKDVFANFYGSFEPTKTKIIIGKKTLDMYLIH